MNAVGSDMLPRLSSQNTVSSVLGHSIFSGNRRLRQSAIGIFGTHLNHFIFREPGQVASLTFRAISIVLSALLDHIFEVLLRCTDKQVGITHAAWIVAMMAKEFLAGVGTMGQLPSEPMRS